jgi:hypothetical protein
MTTTKTMDPLFKLAPLVLLCTHCSPSRAVKPDMQSKPLDQQKLSQFTANTVRKSKREKEAEAAEAKRREEEEHAAKVLFVHVLDLLCC